MARCPSLLPPRAVAAFLRGAVLGEPEVLDGFGQGDEVVGLGGFSQVGVGAVAVGAVDVGILERGGQDDDGQGGQG